VLPLNHFVADLEVIAIAKSKDQSQSFTTKRTNGFGIDPGNSRENTELDEWHWII
jgi:hypothetical protein